jgi:hypothetical protein
MKAAVPRVSFLFAAASLLALTALWPQQVTADHNWGKYHWPRTTNPVALDVGTNLSSNWSSHLTGAISDWNQSSVLNLRVVSGESDPSSCPPTFGRIEVCNANSGNTGWLGIAQIWTSRGSHIVQATSRMNDYYFNQQQYNTSAWRQLVMCQEIAHDFGLDHQDENFYNANLGTCMDYTADPDGPPSNEHPNQHDYDQLEAIYSHLDTGGGGGGGGGRGRMGGPPDHIFPLPPQANDAVSDDPRHWGLLVRSSGLAALFERDFGNGNRVFTFVIWAR